MRYVLVQSEIDPPSVEQVRAALMQTIDLHLPIVPADAHAIVNDSFGILAQRLTREQAEGLARAFANVGYPVEAVAERDLFALPPGRHYNRLDVNAEALVVYDLYGRGRVIGWDRVLVVAAGLVARKQFNRGYRLEPTRGHGEGAVVTLDVEEVERVDSRLEVLTDTEPQRITADARRLNYAGLGERRVNHSVKNFMTLLRDLAAHATLAARSRGFEAFVAAGDDVPVYPNARCFEEELTWLVWHAMRG